MRKTLRSPRAHQVADLLTRLRNDAGLRQEDVAKLIGTSRTVINAYEHALWRPEVARVLQLFRVYRLTLTAVVDVLHRSPDGSAVPLESIGAVRSAEVGAGDKAAIEEWIRSTRACLGRVLREVREEQGLRDTDVAEKLGKPQAFVSKYEGAKSESRNLDLVELAQVAAALGKSWVAVVERFEREVSPAPLVVENSSPPAKLATEGAEDSATAGAEDPAGAVSEPAADVDASSEAGQ